MARAKLKYITGIGYADAMFGPASKVGVKLGMAVKGGRMRLSPVFTSEGWDNKWRRGSCSVLVGDEWKRLYFSAVKLAEDVPPVSESFDEWDQAEDQPWPPKLKRRSKKKTA